MKYIVIYTDGSCNVRTGLGGYGSLMQYRVGKKIVSERELSVGYKNTTVSRMELRAIIESLRLIKKKNIPIILISDSEYTVNSVNKGWVFNWERNGIRSRKNWDLWEQFLEVYRSFPKGIIEVRHTKGHGRGKECYQEGNSRADELASYKNFEYFIEDNPPEVA